MLMPSNLLTMKVITTDGGYVSEAEYKDAGGITRGYWAYGYWDDSLPFTGDDKQYEKNMEHIYAPDVEPLNLCKHGEHNMQYIGHNDTHDLYGCCLCPQVEYLNRAPQLDMVMQHEN